MPNWRGGMWVRWGCGGFKNSLRGGDERQDEGKLKSSVSGADVWRWAGGFCFGGRRWVLI